MMPRWKKLVAIAAIYLVALQAILTGFAPAAMAYDPIAAAVICHSDGTPADNTTAPATQLPQACRHCVLCNATPHSNAPDAQAVLAFAFVPGDAVAPPMSAPALSARAVTVHLARGPPQTV